MFTRSNKKSRQIFLKRYGMNPFDESDIDRTRDNLDIIRIYYDETYGINPNKTVDDITWNDLEMDEVFLRINQTKSYIGEQFLYKRLREPNGNRDWNEFENKVKFYEDFEADRLKLEEKLSFIGKKEEDYYLPMFINNLDSLKIDFIVIYHIFQILLFGFGILALFTKNVIFMGLFIFVAVFNLVIYMYSKTKNNILIYSLGSIKQVVDFSNMIKLKTKYKEIFWDNDVEKAVHNLSKVSKYIGRFQIRRHSMMQGDELSFLSEYIIGITLYDIVTFNYIVRYLKNKKEYLWCLFEFVGKVDMGISVASFRESKGRICIPDFNDNGGIIVESITHPIIENAVGNNFILDKNVIITGANAAGKSTFMKAIAINVILAQTIHTCTASHFMLPCISVMTSMSVRDDVMSGESYYVREIKHLKRMLDSIEGKVKYLLLIDEIFKGTNTKERLASSEAVLRYLTNKNCLVIVATHDTELVENVKNNYSSYYFDSYMKNNDITFDYIIRSGVVERTNAIALLTCFDFHDKIIEDAKRLAGM